jgi:ABC-type sulfate transport system permease component
MAVYPVSLGITAVIVTVSYLMRRSRIFAELEQKLEEASESLG